MAVLFSAVRPPAVKMRVLPQFPARVAVASPILLDTTGGVYTFDFDVDSLTDSLTATADASVLAAAGTAIPLVNGTAAVGTAGLWAREDHVHPDSSSFATADKVYFVSTAGSDANTGRNPSAAKLTLQAAVTAANPNGTVYVGDGTFTLATALLMQPGVRLFLSAGTVITQGGAANLAPLVDFTTNSAHGAAIIGGTINGNRANNTEGTGTLVAIGAANDVRIERVSLINAPGNALTIAAGLRPRVVDCVFTNINLYGVYIGTGTANTGTQGRFTGNHFNAPLGYHIFGIWNSNGNIISGNKVIASLVGGVSNVMTVDTSGTTVTWASGPTFANVEPGMFLVMNAGGEYLVTAKASSTSLTVSPTPGTTTGVPAVFGTGDLIGIDSSSDNVVENNYLYYGATAGIIISNASGGASARRNKIRGNQLFSQGECALAASRSVGVHEVGENEFSGNTIYNAAQTGSTAGPSGAYRAGITIVGAAIETTIIGNTVIDDQATKTMDYWLGLSSVAAGECMVSGNHSVGPTNGAAILAGYLSTTLTNWGTSPAASNAVSHGGNYYVRVTAGSGAPGTNPNVVFNLAATGFSTFVTSKCVAVATGAIISTADTSTNTSGVHTITFIGTPTASAVYDFYVVSW